MLPLFVLIPSTWSIERFLLKIEGDGSSLFGVELVSKRVVRLTGVKSTPRFPAGDRHALADFSPRT